MGSRDRHRAALEVGSMMRVPTVGIAVATLCIVVALASTEEEHEVNYVKRIEALLDGAHSVQALPHEGGAQLGSDVGDGIVQAYGGGMEDGSVTTAEALPNDSSHSTYSNAGMDGSTGTDT